MDKGTSNWIDLCACIHQTTETIVCAHMRTLERWTGWHDCAYVCVFVRQFFYGAECRQQVESLAFMWHIPLFRMHTVLFCVSANREKILWVHDKILKFHRYGNKCRFFHKWLLANSLETQKMNRLYTKRYRFSCGPFSALLRCVREWMTSYRMECEPMNKNKISKIWVKLLLTFGGLVAFLWSLRFKPKNFEALVALFFIALSSFFLCHWNVRYSRTDIFD